MVVREQGHRPLTRPRTSDTLSPRERAGFMIFALSLGERVDRGRRFDQTARAG
jgi:hypothetical protein